MAQPEDTRAPRELCSACGACCRVITIDRSPEELRAIAELTRVLGIPSDLQFAAQHWRPLTRAEAMQRNPFYTAQLPADAYLYTCDQLGDDGRCLCYDERPLVCRGYPWYDAPPRSMPLADPDCGYKEEIPPAQPAGEAGKTPGRAETN
jgi:Fe-S-cluster containining protein